MNKYNSSGDFFLIKNELNTLFIQGIVAFIFISFVFTPQIFAKDKKDASTSIKTIIVQSQEISLEQCLMQALASNFDISIAKLNYKQAKSDISGQKGVFDPSSTFSFSDQNSKSKLRAEQSVIYGGLSSFETKTFNSSADIEQTLHTGTNYSVAFSSDRNTGTFITKTGSDHNGDGIPDSENAVEYDTSLTLSLSQPLLKNFGVKINTASIDLAKFSARDSEFSLKQTLTNIITDVQKKYWDLVLAKKNLKVKEKALQLANDFLKLNKTRVKLGALPQLDLVIAEAEVANREQAIIEAKNNVENAEDNLLFIMNLSSDNPVWNEHLVPTTELKYKFVPIELKKAFSTAIKNRFEYKKALLAFKSAQLSYKLAKNAVLPSLDFTSSFKASDVDNQFDNSFSGALQADSYYIYGGLSLQLPWRNRTAIADKAKSEAAIRLAETNLNKTSETIRHEVRTIVREIDKNFQQIKASKKSLVLAEKKLKAEETKYEIGISTSYNVIEFQKDLVEAESMEMAAKIAFKKSVIDYYKALGITLSLHKQK